MTLRALWAGVRRHRDTGVCGRDIGRIAFSFPSRKLLGTCFVAAIVLLARDAVAAISPTSNVLERMVELTLESQKAYPDPFNDVDVDVIFTRDHTSWRVPAFWRGGQQWTVRFAPITPGEYSYRWESTDKANSSLNGHSSRVRITAYRGDNELLKHGMLRVSSNKRYFEQADGTPFYWLGDTWWTGLSDRLPWDGFQTLTADRKKKGFTVVQICAGLIPSFEELTPIDPGYRNEGGAVWDPQFNRINPRYFDFADRRFQHLIDAGIAPAVVGGWSDQLSKMGSAKMKKHWRYIIARYGAYPVFWVVGAGVFNPPQAVMNQLPKYIADAISPGWSDIVRYVRATDPYHHPLTVHEGMPPYDIPLPEDSLTDFDLTQPGHAGWASIGAEVMQLNTRYARTDLTKPLVVGEIGYENEFGTHLEDFQRMGYWLAMLNGAAGYTYGAGPTFEVNNPDKPLHRNGQYTFFTWQEGMNLPGSYEVGLGANLLRQYPWWQFTPRPQWVTPGGTTLLEPHSGRPEFDPEGWKNTINADFTPSDAYLRMPESVYPTGEWRSRQGTFRKPYAAGIPGKIRVIYIPSFGSIASPPPTVLDLEKDVRYGVYYWEPTLGIKFDLGTVVLPAPGAVEFQDGFEEAVPSRWAEQSVAKTKREGGTLLADGDNISVVKNLNLQNTVVTVDAHGDSSAGLLLRYHDADDYLVAVYSAKEESLYWITRSKGVESAKLGTVTVPELGQNIHLRAEARLNFVAASITDGIRTYSTPIVDVRSGWETSTPVDASKIPAGTAGLLHQEDGRTQRFDNFEARQSPRLAQDESLNRKLYDARGEYRGELSGPGWDEYGRNKTILLNAYRPERLPSNQDWVLVLEAKR